MTRLAPDKNYLLHFCESHISFYGNMVNIMKYQTYINWRYIAKAMAPVYFFNKIETIQKQIPNKAWKPNESTIITNASSALIETRDLPFRERM